MEEVQGDYGLVTLSERTLQKVWLHRCFDTSRLVTLEGQSLSIESPGGWNHTQGPDFRDAVFYLDGVRYSGDVEIHFYVRDWMQHGHNADKEYSRVKLHVVLYPPNGNAPVCETLAGTKLPTLVLLPLLYEDLESLAMSDPFLSESDERLQVFMDHFKSLQKGQQLMLLEEAAQKRWLQKCRYAEEVIQALGWHGACHRAVLDALGYRRNRVAMRRLSETHSLDQWLKYRDETFYEEQKSNWCLSGVRPANHPRLRLQQYRKLLQAYPYYMDQWFMLELPMQDSLIQSTSVFRKMHRVPYLRQYMGSAAFAGVFSGSRLDTLIIDVLLPYLSAQKQEPYFALWYNWFSGDIPRPVDHLMRFFGIYDSREYPRCNGLAQAALQILLEDELLVM